MTFHPIRDLATRLVNRPTAPTPPTVEYRLRGDRDGWSLWWLDVGDDVVLGTGLTAVQVAGLLDDLDQIGHRP